MMTRIKPSWSEEDEIGTAGLLYAQAIIPDREMPQGK